MCISWTCVSVAAHFTRPAGLSKTHRFIGIEGGWLGCDSWSKLREMKAWIATIKEPDMRKALTWLLEHPWGTGPVK